MLSPFTISGYRTALEDGVLVIQAKVTRTVTKWEVQKEPPFFLPEELRQSEPERVPSLGIHLSGMMVVSIACMALIKNAWLGIPAALVVWAIGLLLIHKSEKTFPARMQAWRQKHGVPEGAKVLFGDPREMEWER